MDTTTLRDASARAQASSSASHRATRDIKASNATSEKLAPRMKVDEPPKFDLEAYIANYTGRTRFNRLYFIGITSTVLSVDALKMAIAEAQNGKDIRQYEKAALALSEVAPGNWDGLYNPTWVRSMRDQVETQSERLEHQLRGYKNNLIKESIRMGNEDLGNHYFETGNLIAASKAYSRMRDYCTTPSHIASMLFKMINVSIERGDWLSVQSYVHRLRNSQSRPEDLIKNQPKMAAALGLAQMHAGLYLEAANTFLSTDPTLGDTFNEVLIPNDIAVYGGLCALASMDRHDLQDCVLDNESFRNFLELEPHIRRAIAFYCNSKFRPCLDILESYRADYLLDIHLQHHVAALYKRIRTKSIQQYLVPFSCVTLDSMATIFAPDVIGGQAQPTGMKSPFVQELIGLIKSGILDVRIDLERGVLVSNQKDLRAQVQAEALENLRTFNEEAHFRILRAVVLKAGLQVPGPANDRRFRTGDPMQARGTTASGK